MSTCTLRSHTPARSLSILFPPARAFSISTPPRSIMEGMFRCDCELEGPGKAKTSCHHGISDAEYNFLIDNLPRYLQASEDKTARAVSQFLINLHAEFVKTFPDRTDGNQDALQWCIHGRLFYHFATQLSQEPESYKDIGSKLTSLKKPTMLDIILGTTGFIPHSIENLIYTRAIEDALDEVFDQLLVGDEALADHVQGECECGTVPELIPDTSSSGDDTDGSTDCDAKSTCVEVGSELE